VPNQRKKSERCGGENVEGEEGEAVAKWEPDEPSRCGGGGSGAGALKAKQSHERGVQGYFPLQIIKRG
jgi:hypothetical protein